MGLPRFPVVGGLSYPLREPLHKPKNRTEFENGTVQSRVRFTRSRKRFALQYKEIPMEDMERLQAFFDTTGADAFIFTHPLTGREYCCIISDDAFDASLVGLDWYDVNLNIEEK